MKTCSKILRARLLAIAIAVVAAVTDAGAGEGLPASPGEDVAGRPCFAGSSMFLLANLAREDPPSFYQLNLGYRLTPKDAISVEMITWRYTHPLGIPYGPSFGAKEERYPGSVRGTGAGLAYQRYLWHGLYSAIHATALRQDYQDLDGKTIQRGFQLFTALRTGYHVELLHHRMFLEPSLAVTCWPINTHVPAAFKALDDKWPSYFVGEPGLHVGVRF